MIDFDRVQAALEGLGANLDAAEMPTCRSG